MYEEINSKILEINRLINDNIKKLKDNRGLLSANILNTLRTFLEHIFLKMYMINQGNRIEIEYPNIKSAIKHVYHKGELSQFRTFHKLLQISKSHYSKSYDNSERLMLNYYEYLLYTKNYCSEKLSLNILENLSDFPLNIDETYIEYYEKIAFQIDKFNKELTFKNFDDRYYVKKIKPFFIKNKIYYEVTLSTANDYASKFDRIIAFTKFKILPNYSIKVHFQNSSIDIFGKNMPIKIIDNWMVSIRNCEIKNFSKIFGKYVNPNNSKEFYYTMKYLTKTYSTFVDLIDIDDNYYNTVYNEIHQNNRSTQMFDVLNIIRKYFKNGKKGTNILRYLLFTMNNKVIKSQIGNNPNNNLSNLYLHNGSIPFDKMPFAFSLKHHNPKFSDIFKCINPKDREHEILARIVKINTEYKGQIYTKIDDLKDFNNINELANKYNNILYSTHKDQKLVIENNLIYIKNYELEIIDIIERLKNLTESGIRNYRKSVESWLNNNPYNIDCPDKKRILLNMFEKSRVAMIYGSAGTGKSTLVNHIANFFNGKTKLFLANTHPALENLRNRVTSSNTTFSTIAKFNTERYRDVSYDILIIDECSTLSNSDMLKVLKKADFKLLILVGDIYQIEPIAFGNWFYLAKKLIDSNSIHELTVPWRSKNNKKLQKLWDKVRNISNDIPEYLAKYNYTNSLDESIFIKKSDDEIILCLNYDGLYGVNNINRILQLNNNNPEIKWGIWTYKVGDPILFNESERFTPIIHNNLKGTIKKISIIENKIWFDIEINKVITELDIANLDLELLDNESKNKSLIRFFVNKNRNSDDDSESDRLDIVPFQIAYAVSIHKAQGLEYDTVKIVITNEVEERIKHNIFYTAITRTTNNLKIYWTPECQNYILKNLEYNFNNRDSNIISYKIKNT